MRQEFMPEPEAGVVTTSRFEVWWKVTFGGYSVRQMRDLPIRTPLGQIRTVRHWFLEEPANGNDEEA